MPKEMTDKKRSEIMRDGAAIDRAVKRAIRKAVAASRGATKSKPSRSSRPAR